MARDVEALVLLMDANINKFIKRMDDADRKFDRTANAIERRQRQLDKSLADLGQKAGDFAKPVQIGATLALGAITAMSYEAAKRAEAVNGAFDQIFRAMPEKAAAATSAISDEFGRLETDVKDNFSQLGGVLAGLGVQGEQALSIIDKLQRRSLDLAAFKDVSDAEAFQAVISGITGETEPLKRFGVVVNETATKAELLRLGFKGNAEQAPESAKAIARANLILEKSRELHGQVAREANNLTEQEKRTRAQFTAAAEEFGKQFLPVAADVLKWASEALQAFNDLPTGTQNAALGLLALVAAGGPILAVIGGLNNLIKAAIAARVAIAGIGGTSAGAGAAAGAGAVAGAAARAVPVVATGAAVLSLSGDTQQRALQGQERVNAQLREEARVRGVIADLTRQGKAAEADRQRAYLGRIQTDRQRGQAALRSASPAQGAASEAQKAAKEIQSALGGFTLGQGQMTPVGGAGGGSGGRSGAAAARAEAAERERVAQRREALSLELALAAAQATGSEKAVQAEEERQELIRLTREYQEAGYADAAFEATKHLALINQATLAAEEREKVEEQIDLLLEGRRRQLERQADLERTLNDQLLDRLGFEAELARLSGGDREAKAAERRLWIENRINEILEVRRNEALTREEARSLASAEADQLDNAALFGRVRDEFRDAFSGGLKAAIDGDLGGFFENLADRFTSRMLDNLADDLFDLLAGATKGMGGQQGGGWLSSIVSAVTGSMGKRAMGGPVTAGQPYIVGERRPEVFVPNVGGTIIPSVQAAMAGANRVREQASQVKLLVEASPYFDVRAREANAGPVQWAANTGAQRGATSAVGYVNANAQRQQRQLRAFKN